MAPGGPDALARQCVIVFCCHVSERARGARGQARRAHKKKLFTPFNMCDAIGLSHNWPCRRYELSGVAAALASSQRQCHRSLVVHEVYDTGLGADLSVWASALCEAAERNSSLVVLQKGSLWCKTGSGRCSAGHTFQIQGARHSDQANCSNPACFYKAGRNMTAKAHHGGTTSPVRRPLPSPWVLDDPRSCLHGGSLALPMSCSFEGSLLMPCGKKLLDTVKHGAVSQRSVEFLSLMPGSRSQQKSGCHIFYGCPETSACGNGFGAALEYLFAHLGRPVLDRARSAMSLVFGGSVPSELITVHMRWGDKVTETGINPVDDYIEAVQTMQSRWATSTNATQHVFVTTEDRAALDSFSGAVRAQALPWKIYAWDQSIIQDSRVTSGTGSTPMAPPRLAERSDGSLGITSLAALLIAVEAKYYVLSPNSNWGHLINEVQALAWRRSPCAGQSIRRAASSNNPTEQLGMFTRCPWVVWARSRRATSPLRPASATRQPHGTA